MTAEQFRKTAQRIFGKSWGWQKRCADKLGLDQGTVSRYLSGTVPVPKPIENLLGLLAESGSAAD